MKRILCIFGTRPEVIKMAPVIHALAARPDAEVIACDTGQHREMSAPILEWFGIRSDHQLGLMTHNQSLSHFMAQALVKLDDVIAECAPDLLVCQGDTTTASAAALAAFHRRIPVAHVEAGLRTGDRTAPWPEEINRRIIDLVAHHYFAPTQSSADALLREGVPAAGIHITGNTAIDALLWTLKKLEQERPYTTDDWPEELRAIVAAPGQRPFVLVTAHRRESFGAGMQSIADALVTLAARFPEMDWIFPVHLNPNVRAVMHAMLADIPNMKLVEPLDYPRFCWLLSRCKLVLTDSGGIQEEAPALGKPVLIMREVTERPEALTAGAAKLVGCSAPRIVEETARLLSDGESLRGMCIGRQLFGDGTAATQIIRVLLMGHH
jgi:UDP-N-acetylglucosamine 2-epimerase